ncbi:MAG: hypothetical protein CR217_14110 [Beijerinckiaceae bacterium]|nr:MAG: hypothetical protein CR217_14110 [Beijerinckiaceae bacterium]
MPIVKMPADETIKEKFSEYVAALGKVAHSWNFLQERLGQLFVRAIPTAPHKVLLAVWYSEQNDRAQRRMLRAAINSGAIDSWPSKLPTNAKDDILRLLEEADKLGLKRDQAIHTPCAIMTNTKELK